jgi:hypothetical protein
VSKRLAPDAENLFVLANQVLPHSEGEIVLDGLCATKTEASASGREPTPGVFGSVGRGLAFVC